MTSKNQNWLSPHFSLFTFSPLQSLCPFPPLSAPALRNTWLIIWIASLLCFWEHRNEHSEVLTVLTWLFPPTSCIFFEKRRRKNNLTSYTSKKGALGRKPLQVLSVRPHVDSFFWGSWRSPWAVGPTPRRAAAALARFLYFAIPKGTV